MSEFISTEEAAGNKTTLNTVQDSQMVLNDSAAGRTISVFSFNRDVSDVFQVTTLVVNKPTSWFTGSVSESTQHSENQRRENNPELSTVSCSQSAAVDSKCLLVSLQGGADAGGEFT